MAGRRPKLPRGFISAHELCRRARAKGIELNEKSISALGSRGELPFAKRIPNRPAGSMFSEAKVNEILAVAPGRARFPKGSVTSYRLIAEAKKHGLTIHLADIQTKLKNTIKGKEPAVAGLASDRVDIKHRAILPRAFCETMLQEARMRKNLPKMLQAGYIVPLSQVAVEVGLRPRSLHQRNDIKSFKAGAGRYVWATEAERFKAEHVKRERGTRRAKPEKIRAKQAKPAGEKKQQRRANKAGQAKNGPKPVEKPNSAITAQHLADQWLMKHMDGASPGQMTLLERVVKQSKRLPTEEFEKSIRKVMERILYG